MRCQLRASKGINKAPAVRLVQQTAPTGAVRVLATQAAPNGIAPRGSMLSLPPHGTILRVLSHLERSTWPTAAPNRLAHHRRCDFRRSYARPEPVDLEGVHLKLIGLEPFKTNKRAAGRLKDLADPESLKSDGPQGT